MFIYIYMCVCVYVYAHLCYDIVSMADEPVILTFVKLTHVFTKFSKCGKGDLKCAAQYLLK